MSSPEFTPDLASIDEENIPAGHRSGFVAVIGRPNVGKSTLLNALLKQKVAIVSPRPQTTRIRQLGIITEADHQIIFIDTPGLMTPRHKLDEFMREIALEALQDGEVVVWLVDGSEAPGPADRAIAEQLKLLTGPTKVLLAINKADLLAPAGVIERANQYRQLLPQAYDWILFSALDSSGREALYRLILAALPEGPRYYPADQITDLFLRDIAAELIREQILLQIRDEVPHGVAVQVNEFKERDNGLTYINATIFVERDGHKRIIIGAKGTQLQQIGAAARKEIEALLEGKVFLELWVKVEAKWRHDEQSLKRFGYVRKDET